MKRTILKGAGLLVGAHLLLGASLLLVEAAHGINDQDASFALACVYQGLNYPTVWALRQLTGAQPSIGAVLAAGVAQWAALGAALGALLALVRKRRGDAAAGR